MNITQCSRDNSGPAQQYQPHLGDTIHMVPCHAKVGDWCLVATTALQFQRS